MNPIKHDMGEVWAGGICACPEAEMGARERLSLAVSVAERVRGTGLKGNGPTQQAHPIPIGCGLFGYRKGGSHAWSNTSPYPCTLSNVDCP